MRFETAFAVFVLIVVPFLALVFLRAAGADPQGATTSGTTAPPGGHTIIVGLVREAGTASPPVPSPTAVPAPPLRGKLTEEQMRAALSLSGWPASLHDQALAVCKCESDWNTEVIGDYGKALGLMQLWPVWRTYCGIAYTQARESIANLECAWKVYQYDVDHGYAPWKQWSCRRVLN